jgi:hypothetical protein
MALEQWIILQEFWFLFQQGHPEKKILGKVISSIFAKKGIASRWKKEVVA